MKKYLLTIALLSFAFTFNACNDDDDVIIGESDLPSTAKTFVATHFPSAGFVWGERDNDSYDIRLDNGFELDFSLDGTWDNVDSNHAKEVPASIIALIPESISTYISEKHQGAIITKVDKEHDRKGNHTGYEIELNNSQSDLKFGLEGNFIRYDN
ncbi:MAG: PepSY-like domain-containing protein [Tannerella sp.]|nr:PepSY-like domain-containing protein [Tannerella sp.]